MDVITNLKASTENFLTRMKGLEKLFATIPKHQIKAELGIQEYERIVAILEYVNIKTTEIAKSLKDDIKVDLFEEQESFFFTLKDDNKLKKQKAADDNIPQILELANVYGLDIERNSVVTNTEPKDSEERISTNKILAKARKQLSQDDYLKLRKHFEKEGWIVIENDKDIDLVEDSLKTRGELLNDILDRNIEDVPKPKKTVVKQAIEMGQTLTKSERVDLFQHTKDEIVRIRQDQEQ